MDSPPEPLAIVGIGCRFPGGGDSAAQFWELLCSETDATRLVPENRWDAGRYHDPNPGKVGKIVTCRGGFLDEIDQFDPQFFGISPREAHSLDPQQRLLLQATWEAFEDAGIPADSLAGTDVGVFVGGFTLDYQLLQNQGTTSRYRFKAHSATGMMMTMLANRLSYAFDFRGPSMTVDTACSSSLVAVHLAAQSIWNGECSMALAGGVNVIIGPNTAIAESKSGFLSPEGRSKAFDDSADGYARGEGGAVVLIKTVTDALRDGDEIYAQILGTAVSQDGRTDGITVPREEAQEAAIRSALHRAGVAPADVGYVEAHGTGTPVGDPIEMQALANALAVDRPDQRPLLIGSVKTNIGHLEAGAGVAGLIKAAMVLKYGFIPANLHLKNPTRHVSLADLKIDIPAVGRPFPDHGRRIAGVNSFGFGGTNAHAVLAEPPATSTPSAPTPAASADSTGPVLLPISARSEDALIDTARRLSDHLASHPDISLDDLAYTLGERRAHLNHRHTVIADSVDDARAHLRSLADGGQVAVGRTGATAPKLAFVCSGMGPQWWRMCRDLLEASPVFYDSIVRTDRELSRHAGWSLLEELRRDEDSSRMGDTEYAQPANFAVQLALAAHLEQAGIHPDAVIGHSAGEVAAHHLAGLLTFEQAVAVIYHRSRLQQRTSGQGRMLAVGLDAESLMGALDEKVHDEFGRRVSVAAINSPSAVTLAGDSDVLEDVARQLDEAEIFNRYLAVKVPYHTHYMDTIKSDLFAALDGLAAAPAQLPLYSTVTGELLGGYDAGAAYWWQNTRATVLFEPAMRRMLDDGYTHFVELAPHPVLAASILETAGAQRVSVLATQRRDHDDHRTLLTCLGALYSAGHDIDWAAVNSGSPRRRLKLPSYPWQTRRYWNETTESTESLFYRAVHPLLGQPVTGVHPTWEAELSTLRPRFLADHRIQGSVVLPGSVYIEMALAAARLTYGSTHSVDNLVLHRAVILDDTCDPVVRTTLNQDDGTLEFAAFTATADGELKWTLTATAELNTLRPAASRAGRRPSGSEHRGGDTPAEPTTAIGGDEFYARTEAIGFDYGDAFRTVAQVVAGEDWARAEIQLPSAIADELDQYRFHPALIDGAFQTLFGAPFLGQEESDDPYLPTRIRRCAVHGPPEERMTVHVDVLSATREEVESTITVTGRAGTPLVVIEGFSVQSLSSSSRMSVDRIDKGLYEIRWRERVASETAVQPDTEPGDTAPQVEDADNTADTRSWLVFLDGFGAGTALTQELRRRGHRVHTVAQGSGALAEVEGGYVLDPSDPDQVGQLVALHLGRDDDLAGIVDLWPIDMAHGPTGTAEAETDPSAETDDDLGVFTVVRLVKALAQRSGSTPRLHLATANAQPVLGGEVAGVEQAAIWGLGRVVGHQEFAERWGSLIDIDRTDDLERTAVALCDHLLADESEDQVALRGDAVFVPRLGPCSGLTKPFPTKLTPDATYVVTGGAGALGRVVATYLAERGARHLTLLGRSPVPPREQWSALGPDDPHYATVSTIRAIERRGAHVTTASVDITDAGQVAGWLADHLRTGGRPVRGLVHAAGSVADQLLVTMSEQSFADVLAPKITGTRVLHEALADCDLEFFVMFGSAGSTIAAPGQANYAAANAFLDAFAHHRRSLGLPALTIGWGPWSVGMVEELKLERIYEQRGIELITPAVGSRILDRLMTQSVPCVVAITADWARARNTGLGGRLPAMFSELDAGESIVGQTDSDVSIIELLAAAPDGDRHGVVAERVRRIVAGVFDCAVDDIEPDDMLDDVGLDSMMAMDFRVRINSMFSIDLPVLEILRGVSVNSLSERILTELLEIHGHVPASADMVNDDTVTADMVTDDTVTDDMVTDDDMAGLIDGLSEAELQALLTELESQATEQGQGGPGA